MTSSIKITSLTDIGANLSTTSLVPVVNMSGVPETQKANLQIVGNLILTGAGTSFPPVAQAVLAQSVTNAAQPNITSIGTLSALNVSGNVTTGNLVAGNIVGTLTGSATTAGTVTTNAQPNITSVGTLNGLTVNGLTNLGPIGNVTITGGSAGQVLSTDGAGNLSWVSDATSTYGDGNVTSLLAAFGSNTITTTGLITGDGGGLSNVPYANLSGAPSLGNISGLNIDGDSSNILYGNGIFAAAPNIALTGDGGNLSNITGSNVVGNVGSSLIAYSVDAANVSGLGNIATVNLDGNVSNVLAGDGTWIAAGGGGNTGNFTFNNTVMSVPTNDSLTLQVSDSDLVRSSFILDPSYGIANLSVTSSESSQYFDTGNWGTGEWIGTNAVFTNATDIIAFMNSQLWNNSNDQFISINGGPKVPFGGAGYGPTDITFNNVGTADPDPTTITTFELYYRVKSQIYIDYDDFSEFNITSNDLNMNITSTRDVTIEASDDLRLLGNDITRLAGNAEVTIQANSANTSMDWNFNPNGNLVLANGLSVVRSIPNSSLDPLNPGASTMEFTPDQNYNLQSLVLDPTSPGHIHLRAPSGTGNIDEPAANIFLGGEISSFEVGGSYSGAPNVYVHSNNNTWTFDTTGNLTLPGNTFSVNYANGTQVSLGGGSYDDSNVVSLLSSFGSNTITTTGVITADGYGLSNVPYANLTGAPTLGNISSINIDGNAGNILYGNGVFAASPSVVLSGDGGNISNIAGANVTGTVANANLAQFANVTSVSNNYSYHIILSGGPGDKSLHVDFSDNLQYNPNTGTLTADRVDAQYLVGNLEFANGYYVGNVVGIGNIATINTNGNASQVLYGNGVFAGLPSVSLTGDGGNLSNIAGANVSGEVSYAAVANSVAAANVSGLGNISTINLDGNASNLISGAGTFVTIPVVPTVGNIATLNLDGNASNLLYGNGVFAAAPPVPAAGSNTQITFNDNSTANGSANLTFDKTTSTLSVVGNVTANNFTGTSANVTLVAGSYNYTFDNAGTASMPGNLTVTGNANVSGVSSNIIRRAFGLVASDVGVTLDDLTVTVSSATSQLTLSTSGSWQGTGWTETFAGGGTPTVNNWVNLPLNPGFNNASGAMTSQGNGCRCIISDQTPSAKVYQITVVRSGTTGTMWNISIERLV